MFRPTLFIALVGTFVAIASAQRPPEEKYPVHPDSIQKPGVPEGVITQGLFKDSMVFPGTTRDYTILRNRRR
jgi:hypothetical protein